MCMLLIHLKACSSTWQIADRCCDYTDISSRHGINRCICNTCVIEWCFLKPCSSIWQIGNECWYYTDISSRNKINRWICNTKYFKYTIANNRLVIDAVIILTLVHEMEFIDVFVKPVFAIFPFLKNVVAHDKIVVDAATLLTLVEEIKLIDTFVIHMFAVDTF